MKPDPDAKPHAATGAGPARPGRLPTGTVTLLFSDIEGSTRLLQELGSQYERALIQHDEIIRAVIRRHGGEEVGHEGDAFFVAFSAATAAVKAAVQAQRQLAGHEWPGHTSLRVRMGLHTGSPTVTEDDYLGLDVHRASRICSAAYGGQILVSQATKALVEDLAGDDIELRDLGEHRLRDLDRPERLFQVSAAGLEAEFPALRTLEAPVNLPTMPTTLVGRERELDEVASLVGRPDARLVSLLGPGGTGKTRLAVRLAERLAPSYLDGVFFVALAPVEETTLVASTIARSLRLEPPGAQSPIDAITTHMRDRHALLVLDNFEHVVQAAPVVAELLTSCPRLDAVVTSRTALRISGEHEYQVPPLSLPDPATSDIESVCNSEAVNLFVERARAIDPTFRIDEHNASTVVGICRRLDGLPLAIELAAARMRLLAPDALLGRLDRHLKLLTGGPRDAPARQQTLRGAIEWSYEMLLPSEQAGFRRLSPFAGGWTLESAEAVVDPSGELDADTLEILASLLDKSLVRRDDNPSGDTRLSMLRTIRDYALEKLAEDPDSTEVHRRHALYFAEMALTAQGHLLGAEQAEWLEKLEAEHDNLRAALDYAHAHPADDHLGLRLAGSLGRFWYTRAYVEEGSRRLETALEADPRAPDELRAKALQDLGVLLAQRTDHTRATAALQEALQLHRRLGNQDRVAAALNSLGVEAYSVGNLERATELLQESLQLRRASGDDQGIPTVLANLALVALTRDDPVEAERLLNQALELDRRYGNEWGVGIDLANLSAAAIDQGDLARAEDLLQQAVPILQRLGERDGLADCLERGVGICSARERWEDAARLAGAADALREEIGSPLVSSDERRLENYLAPVRSHLSKQDLSQAWREGRGLSLEEALEQLPGADRARDRPAAGSVGVSQGSTGG